MAEYLTCKILTPEKTRFQGTAEMVIVPAYDGELGILCDHAPLVAKLAVGECRIKGSDGETRFYVEGGIVKVRTTGTGEDKKTEVTLLPDESFTIDELVEQKVEIEQEREEAKKLEVMDKWAFEERTRKLRGTQAKLKLIGEEEKE